MVFQLHYVQLVSLVGFMNALWTKLDDHVVFIAFGNCSWSHAEVEMYKSNQNHASMKTKNRETRMCPENLKPIYVLMCFLGTSGLPATRIHQLLDRKHSTCDRMKTKKKANHIRDRYCEMPLLQLHDLWRQVQKFNVPKSQHYLLRHSEKHRFICACTALHQLKTIIPSILKP